MPRLTRTKARNRIGEAMAKVRRVQYYTKPGDMTPAIYKKLETVHNQLATIWTTLNQRR